MSTSREPQLPDDPSGIDGPHDTLAAEEFAVPARDVGAIPPDPTGLRKPHDVLAAEDFAMPGSGLGPDTGGGLDPRSFVPGLVLAAVLLLAFHMLRRRGD